MMTAESTLGVSLAAGRIARADADVSDAAVRCFPADISTLHFLAALIASDAACERWAAYVEEDGLEPLFAIHEDDLLAVVDTCVRWDELEDHERDELARAGHLELSWLDALLHGLELLHADRDPLACLRAVDRFVALRAEQNAVRLLLETATTLENGGGPRAPLFDRLRVALDLEHATRRAREDAA